MTEFGKACRKLGIEIITANSPQAKGRVERKHGVYQDRFVKELRLGGITTIKEANKLLRNGFVDMLNRKFARPPLHRADFHRPVDAECDLCEIFCFEKTRTVANDWTVQCESRFYQILKQSNPLPRARQKVTVRRLLDGVVQILYHDRKLKFKEIPPPVMPLCYTEPAAPQPAQKEEKKKKYKPAPDHPWRRGLTSAARRI
jgi:hypothetical protein